MDQFQTQFPFTPNGNNVVYYSHSRLKDQAQCPARNYYHKLSKAGIIKEDLNLSLIAGSATHRGIELRLKEDANPFKVADDYLNEQLSGVNTAKLNKFELDAKKVLINKCLTNFEANFFPYLKKTISDPQKDVEVRLETPFRKGILLGVVDLIMPGGIYVDWKGGTKVPTTFGLQSDPQAGFYYYLAQQNGLETPKEFVYVYLIGKNVNMTTTKTGKIRANSQDRKLQFSFAVYPTEEKVKSLLNNYIIPLAKQFEDEVYYKVPSDFNCNGCRYRTACYSGNYDLPTILEPNGRE